MKKFFRFAAVVCGVSWLVALAFHLITGYDGYPIGTPDNYQVMGYFAPVYMFLPLVCAIVLQRIDKEKMSSTGLLNFKFSWAWLAAWLVPVLVVFLSIIANIPFAHVFYPTDGMPSALTDMLAAYQVPPEALEGLSFNFYLITTIVSGLIAGVTINAVLAFGEEYGWRNYMVHALRNVKFPLASLLIGVVWGLWHFPLILMGHNYPSDRIAGIFLMTVMCVLLGIIELYFVLKTRSVFAAAIIHGTFNALAGLGVFFVEGGSGITNYVTGVSGFIAGAVVCLGIFVYDFFISKDKIFAKTLGERLEK